MEIPIFAHLRFDLNKAFTVNPFFDFKIGYTVYDCRGFYMNPSIGCRFKLSDYLGMNVSMGYTMQMSDVIYYWVDSYYNLYYYTEKTNVGGISIKIGLDF